MWFWRAFRQASYLPVFGVVAALVALHMLLTPEGMHLSKGLPGKRLQSIMATTIGTISTLLPPFLLGYVNVAGFVAIAATSMLFVPLGAKVAHAIDPKWLRRLFGVFLAITSARMPFDAVARFVA